MRVLERLNGAFFEFEDDDVASRRGRSHVESQRGSSEHLRPQVILFIYSRCVITLIFLRVFTSYFETHQ